jgi:hypothetical protein
VHASPRNSARSWAIALAFTSIAVATMSVAHPRAADASTSDSLTFTPVADTYVDSSSPSASFGTAVSFWVDGSPTKQGFVRFQVSAVSGRELSDVRLLLYQTDSSSTGGRVWAMTSNTWTESTTWNSRPAIDGQQLAAIGSVTQETWYEADLGPEAVSGDGLVSFAVDSTDPDGARWTSREGAHPPQLVVDLAPVIGDRFAFTPEADTYVDASQPSASFGSNQSLWVDGSPVKQAFFRFDVTGLTGRPILAAHLRMYQFDDSPTGGQIYSMSSVTWPETVTWNTRPAVDGGLLGSFPAVTTGLWYEADLNRIDIFPGDGLVSLAVTSPNSDGAKWKTRESELPPQLILDVAPSPGLVLDGLTQVATRYQGSLQPTWYASNHRMALTSGGRLLAVYGFHATGLQLVWRDPAGGWMYTSSGNVTDGVIDRNGTSGDRPASIVVGREPGGGEHAWVVWSGPSSAQSEVFLRRLSDLDSLGGPTVGPLVTLVPMGLGNSRADVSLETAPDGTLRGCVVWTQQFDPSTWQVVTGWFTDLTTDAPILESTTVILTSSSITRVGTLVPTSAGMRFIARSTNGKLQIFGHDSAAPLTTWWTGAAGVTTSTYSYPSATGLSSGETLAAIESNIPTHVVTVQRFSATGGTATIDLQVTGYAQPSIASDGANAWLAMIRVSDGYLVSRKFTAGLGWDTTDRVEIGAEGGGNYAWPNVVRQTDGRLRLLVRGPAGSRDQDSVLAYQRSL